MPELTLVEAFRRCGPLVGRPEEDAVRSAANKMMHERLKSIVGGRDASDTTREIAAKVMLRLIQKGPRPDSKRDTDELVDAYLRRSIANGFVDRHRSNCRTGQLDDKSQRLVAPAQVRDFVDLARAKESIARAVVCLFGDVAVTCSPATQAAIAVRRRVAEGQCSFDDCVRDAAGEVTVQSRNAFYQRQSRAMRELVRAIGPFSVERGLNEWEVAALHVVFSELKDAEAGWPVEGGA